MKVLFPGLNAPTRHAVDPISIGDMEDEEREKSLNIVRQRLEETGKMSKRRRKEKLHPLERGFSGTQVVGQKLCTPPPEEGVNFDDFKSYCIEANFYKIFL